MEGYQVMTVVMMIVLLASIGVTLSYLSRARLENLAPEGPGGLGIINYENLSEVSSHPNIVLYFSEPVLPLFNLSSPYHDYTEVIVNLSYTYRRIRFYEVDPDDRFIPAYYNITGYPTLLCLKASVPWLYIPGVKDRDYIIRRLVQCYS